MGANLGNFELGGGGPMYAIVYPEYLNFRWWDVFGIVQTPRGSSRRVRTGLVRTGLDRPRSGAVRAGPVRARVPSQTEKWPNICPITLNLDEAKWDRIPPMSLTFLRVGSVAVGGRIG